MGRNTRAGSYMASLELNLAAFAPGFTATAFLAGNGPFPFPQRGGGIVNLLLAAVAFYGLIAAANFWRTIRTSNREPAVFENIVPVPRTEAIAHIGVYAVMAHIVVLDLWLATSIGLLGIAICLHLWSVRGFVSMFPAYLFGYRLYLTGGESSQIRVLIAEKDAAECRESSLWVFLGPVIVHHPRTRDSIAG